jgi:hypothetical protein
MTAERLTLISTLGAPEADYQELEQTFSPDEIVALAVAIVAINSWNRLAISMRAPVGAHVSPHSRHEPPAAPREPRSPNQTER